MYKLSCDGSLKSMGLGEKEGRSIKRLVGDKKN